MPGVTLNSVGISFADKAAKIKTCFMICRKHFPSVGEIIEKVKIKLKSLLRKGLENSDTLTLETNWSRRVT